MAGAAATPAIEPDAVLQHIKFLASDELKGRGDGSPELERAADYIAEQFKRAGLHPGIHDKDWFQPFELIAGLTVGNGNELVLSGPNGQTARFVLGTSYYPLSATPNDAPDKASTLLDDVPVVFAG